MTSPRFLIDSNICIYILSGSGNQLRRRLEECGEGEAIVSAISYAEVMHGIPIGDRERSERANRLFTLFGVVPFDRAAAECYRQLPFRRGRFDRLIGAHALALGVTLVTNNEADFADVPGLKIENWTI